VRLGASGCVWVRLGAYDDDNGTCRSAGKRTLTAAQYLGQSPTHSPTHVDASVSVRVHNVCISNRAHFRDSKDDVDDGNGIE
jgi:hypothetical protein